MIAEAPKLTPSEQFEAISTRPDRKGTVLVFRLWDSSYYPAGLDRHNRNTDDEKYWHEMVRERNLHFSNVLGGANFEGSLFLYQFETPAGPIHLAQMDLRRLFTNPHLKESEGNRVPKIDLSLVSRRALMPNFQQVVGMSGEHTHYAHIYTVDEDGSSWSHHVEQDWKNFPLSTEDKIPADGNS